MEVSALTEGSFQSVPVVGDSMSGKDHAMKMGDLPSQEAHGPRAGVRAPIVAGKSGNSDGAKGGSKADLPHSDPGKSTPSPVPSGGKQEGEAYHRWLCATHKAQYPIWTPKMLMALDKGIKGNRWFSLIDKVHAAGTLELAWEKVKINAGACGVDNMTVRQFSKDSKRRLLTLTEQIRESRYQPKPVKRRWINKPGSRDKRPLGIPTVRDRIVQAALKMVIEPIFEKEFADCSFGFRPGRDCKQALRRVNKDLNVGWTHVVDVDIKGFFDAIPHHRLMAMVAERIADGKVLKLIESFLKQKTLEEGGNGINELAKAKDVGTPQGGVISPLLANIYLNPLDWLMSTSGHRITRYADDMVILCRSRKEAEEAMGTVQDWAESMGLTLHQEKTKIVDMAQAQSHFDFLGYRFWRNRKTGKINRYIRPKSKKKLRGSLKPYLKRTSGKSMEEISRRINPILKGFFNYFMHSQGTSMQEVDQWVRMRLRSILRKRHGLKGAGRGRDHQKWPNRYFAQLGLFSLEQAQKEKIISLRKAATR